MCNSPSEQKSNRRVSRRVLVIPMLLHTRIHDTTLVYNSPPEFNRELIGRKGRSHGEVMIYKQHNKLCVAHLPTSRGNLEGSKRHGHSSYMLASLCLRITHHLNLRGRLEWWDDIHWTFQYYVLTYWVVISPVVLSQDRIGNVRRKASVVSDWHANAIQHLCTTHCLKLKEKSNRILIHVCVHCNIHVHACVSLHTTYNILPQLTSWSQEEIEGFRYQSFPYTVSTDL